MSNAWFGAALLSTLAITAAASPGIAASAGAMIGPPPIFFEPRTRPNTLYLDGRQHALRRIDIVRDTEHGMGPDTIVLTAEFAGGIVYQLYAPKDFFRVGGAVRYGGIDLERGQFDKLLRERAMPLLTAGGKTYGAYFGASQPDGAFLGFRSNSQPNASPGELHVGARLGLVDGSKLVRVRFELLLSDEVRSQWGAVINGP